MHSHNHSEEFPQMGLGCISLTRENNEIVDKAIAAGCRLFDTADCYGVDGESEKALGEKLANYKHMRHEIVVCTKVGVRINADKSVTIDGRPSYIKAAVDASLKRLQLDKIDIVYLHRADPNVCIEESVNALKELVLAGKVGSIGLCEVTAKMIVRAQKVHPIKCVQIEYSPWSTHDQFISRVISMCVANKIQLIASSPLGRGLFTNQTLEYFQNLPEDDYRRSLPRFMKDNLEHNFSQRNSIEDFAVDLQKFRQENDPTCAETPMTVAQLTLMWIMFQSVTPIPATINPDHLAENFAALKLKLAVNEYHCLDQDLHTLNFKGLRYRDEKQSGIYPAADVSFWHQNKAVINAGVKAFGVFAVAAAGAAAVYHVLNKRNNTP